MALIEIIVFREIYNKELDKSFLVTSVARQRHQPQDDSAFLLNQLFLYYILYSNSFDKVDFGVD